VCRIDAQTDVNVGELSAAARHLQLAGEFEDQTVNLVREYKTDRQLLSPHAPEQLGARRHCPDRDGFLD
jgi:hypothetical protein